MRTGLPTLSAFFVFLLTTVSLTQAQSGRDSVRQTGPVQIGFFAGPVLSDLKYDNKDSGFSMDLWDTKLGFSTGIYLEANVSRHFGIRSGLSFDRKGGVLDVNITDENGNLIENAKAKDHLDYLTLPVLLQANVGRKSKLFVQGGAAFSWLIRYKNTKNFNTPVGPPFSTVDFERFEYTALAGAGCRWPFSENMSLEINGLASFGLRDILKDSWGKARNFSLALNFAAMYSL